MNLLFTICARAGSKGATGKNIRIFNGNPLLYYTLSVYELFLESHLSQFDKVDLAINTDSTPLFQQADATCIQYSKVYRKEELAGDSVAKPDVIKDTVLIMEEQNKYAYDLIIDLDLTSPIRTVEDILGSIELMIADKEAGVTYSVTKSRRLPYFNMVKENDRGYMEKIIQTEYVSRQQAPVCYDMNASIYVYRRSELIHGKGGSIFAKKCLAWLMEDTGILDIDCDEDFELLEIIYQHFARKNVGVGTVAKHINALIP